MKLIYLMNEGGVVVIFKLYHVFKVKLIKVFFGIIK